MTYRSPDHVVVRFAGPDAAAFLQSQLTNDVSALRSGGWQWQGYCSAKGRLLATFALTRSGDDLFEAVVPASTAEALVKRLSMFRLRSKLSIELASDRVAAWDFAAEPAVEGAAFALADNRRMMIASATVAQSWPVADAATVQRWQRANIDAMIPEITAATVEMFVPQMIGWDTVQPGGGVSFGKGCYPGQEIVARAHFRGAVKRQLERVKPGARVTAGSDVTLADGRIATVCNQTNGSADGSFVALVVAPIPDAV